jgi:hypothetical protein
MSTNSLIWRELYKNTECIYYRQIFDDGSRGEDFTLECGNAQGNAPSPLQFNLGEQILIFKIEMCPLIRSIMSLGLPPAMEGDRAPGAVEQGGDNGDLLADDGDGGNAASEQGNIIGKEDKVEAFADDGTVLARADEIALDSIKTILSDFASISGLCCNMEKSTVMTLGYEEGEAVPEWISNSGFQVVEHTKVLGCKIGKGINVLTENYPLIVEKIANIKRFWERFNLSLPGRLNVAKSLMLAQIGYIGCFWDLDPED